MPIALEANTLNLNDNILPTLAVVNLTKHMPIRSKSTLSKLLDSNKHKLEAKTLNA